MKLDHKIEFNYKQFHKTKKSCLIPNIYLQTMRIESIINKTCLFTDMKDVLHCTVQLQQEDHVST